MDVPCGLIPGASGGGLFAEVDGTIVLVGIISTVTFDQSANGVVPLDSLHELLEHPQRYRHDLTATRHTGDTGRGGSVMTRLLRSAPETI